MVLDGIEYGTLIEIIKAEKTQAGVVFNSAHRLIGIYSRHPVTTKILKILSKSNEQLLYEYKIDNAYVAVIKVPHTFNYSTYAAESRKSIKALHKAVLERGEEQAVKDALLTKKLVDNGTATIDKERMNFVKKMSEPAQNECNKCDCYEEASK